MSELFVLCQIAFRNLFASFLNIIIGGIILVGTMLFVVGGSLIGSIDNSMSKSITGSIAGDIQVYSDRSKDDIALYDNWTTHDITPIADFSLIKTPLLSIENIKTVIPMGVSGASVTYGNTVDLTLERLRKSINEKVGGNHSSELSEKIESLKSHVRQIISVIQGDYKKFAVLASKDALDVEGQQALEKAASDSFWASFDRDPLNHLEFMENKIAALVPDADLIYFSFLGTDLDAFSQSFDRMQIVDGEKVPQGRRGLLLSKYIYEEQFKIKTARRLDKIHESIRDQGKKISADPDLQLMVKQNQSQTREIVLQLDPMSSRKVLLVLQTFLNSQENSFSKILSEFFKTDDENFEKRYAFFYKEIAPSVELYRLKPGEMLTIKTFTKGGFMQSANLKIYGTFQFKGLEKSGLAGAVSLMDLMTFRDLYGYVTPEKLAESKQLEKAAGLQMIDRDKAESELFGGSSSSVVGSAKEQKIDDKAELGGVKYDATAQSMLLKTYTQNEIEKGVVLNAAILLKDPTKIKDTMAEIQSLSKKEGLDLRVASWQKAAGNIGQFVFVAKAALYFAVFIIFVVALVIINNAVMMATLQRVREIGTMRAIGAHKSFVLFLILIETLCLGLTFGSTGTFLGALIVRWLGRVGIPASNEFLYFFFSGPRLYVQLGLGSVLGAFFIICLVTCFSALYPALVATRVSPIRAMQAED